MYKKKEILDFLTKSVEGKLSVNEQVKFLGDFKLETVNAEDIKTMVNFLFKKMSAKLNMPKAIDICGTGGSGLERINTSTIAAFILAELGVRVAKHGNKAASGRCGSFDLLEALGVDFDKKPEELEKLYAKKNLAFIFARNFHPGFKHFAEARKNVGGPTIFNLLGPLLNPANPKMQIIGTSFKEQMKLIAEASKLLGKKRVMVVRGRDGLDEVSLSEKTDIVELKNGKIVEYSIEPEDFGLERVGFAEIAGGDLEFNGKIAEEILNGTCRDSRADLVFVNCALALKLVGKFDDLKEGCRVARSSMGREKLEACRGNILEEIAASKFSRDVRRNFIESLKKGCDDGRRALIAEIKFASPSKGKIFKGKIGKEAVKKLAKIYEKSGASAISVLTDEKYFLGSFEYLREAKKVTGNVPILCKDFIVSEYQIHKAFEYGADAILLIAELLSAEQIEKFLALARSLEMEGLVEIHNEQDLQKVLKTSAKIIGINNRNLKTFEIDLNTANKLASKIPEDKIIVAESGISDAKDLKKLDKKIQAILVGTAIVQAKNFTKKIHELTEKIPVK